MRLRSSPRAPRCLSLALLLLGLLGPASPAWSVEPALPPLPQGAGFARLPVPGFQSAVVAWPAPGRPSPAPLPIAIAAHGSYDQPEWNCEVFAQVLAGRGIVLCPRGKLRWDSPSEPALLRFYFPSTSGWLGREISAAVSALLASAPTRATGEPLLYIGFSQGAIFGAPLLISQPARFPRAILVEGGHDAWTPEGAGRYRRGGGQRVLFACGRAGCLKSATVAAERLKQAGVASRVVYAADQGHTYDGGVQAAIAAAFAWVVQDDPRFLP